MRTKYIYPFFVILFISGFQITSLSQTSPINIKKLTDGADMILTGKVAKQNSIWNKDKTRIFTEVTVEVEEYLKGNNGTKSIVVITPGGEVGEVGELYTHMPKFNKNEDVLLFVKKDIENENYNVLNGKEGKFTLHNDKLTGEKVTSLNKKISTIKKEIKDNVERQ